MHALFLFTFIILSKNFLIGGLNTVPCRLDVICVGDPSRHQFIINHRDFICVGEDFPGPLHLCLYLILGRLVTITEGENIFI